jgi:5-methylcytosine-specific restriction endonuclease McrA
METVKHIYSNPKFQGLPWSVDQKKKIRGKGKKKKLRRTRRHLVNLNATKCRELLENFWRMFDALPNTSMRLGYLRETSSPGWPRVDEGMRKRLRREFSRRYRDLLKNIDEQCGICGNDRWREKHHIIPLSFGGINDDLNLIAICMKCHNEIHFWMKEAR